MFVAAAGMSRHRVNRWLIDPEVPRSGPSVAAPWRRGSTALIASEVSVGTSSPELKPAGTSASTSGQTGVAVLAQARSLSPDGAFLVDADAVRPEAAGDPPGGAVLGDERDDPGVGLGAGDELEGDAVDIDVAAGVNHDLVPEVGKPREVGVRDH